MECNCYLRNVQHFLVDGKTPYERRFGETFEGPIIPFGAMVEYHPTSPKDQARIHQFGKKVSSGIILGYEPIAGGIWKGNILIADLEDLEKLDASEILILEESTHKEVLMRQKDDEFIFPVSSRWYSKIVKKRLRIPSTHSKARTDPRGVKISVEKFKGQIRRVSYLQNQQMTLKPVPTFWSFPR